MKKPLFICVVLVMIIASAASLPFVLNAGFGQPPQGAQLSEVEASPHYRDGQFHNTLPTPGFTGQQNMLVAWWQFLTPYFLRVEGNSMEDARIHDGDVLVVDRALEPEHGSIVIAAVDNEVSDTLDLREFQQQQEKDFLQTSLQQAKFNQKKAAELLGLTYHQLRALLKKHQI